ncbi:hypothetical protein Mapa_001125 [Marchantia paleacea]|nr:hypothetical protein Mapa_001125 [Marchantia paleacea]
MNGRDGGGGGGRGGRGGGGRQGLSAGWRPVSEADRISIAERLEQFRAANDVKELTFEAGLSNHDRAVVHEFCKKMGFKSKSHGKGEARRVTVQKPASGHGKDQSTTTPLSFSAEAQEAVVDLFCRFPSTEEEVLWKERIVEPCDNTVPKPQGRGKSTGSRNALFTTPADIAKQVSQMASRLKNTPALQQIAQDRSRLPIAAFRDVITSVVENNQVVLIAGETGCGKTTQVPQYILSHVWQQGKPCRIICTQPRRISATSVAERISTELGEQIGDTVGYQIRLESKGGKHSSLIFCTNGVLLRKVVGSGGHSKGQIGDEGLYDETSGLDATHIIVDEIHERDRNADFLLIVLRDLLPLRPDLRLILMSATLDAELFSTYFNGCPIVRVPGFTYPVRTFYLEDVLAVTQNGGDGSNSQAAVLSLSKEDADVMDEAISTAWLDDDFELLLQVVTDDPNLRLCDYQHPLTGATALMVAAGKGRVDDLQLLLSLGADRSIVSQDGANALDWAQRHGHEEIVDLLTNYQEDEKMPSIEEAEMLKKYHASVDQEEIDVRLIERLLFSVCRGSVAEDTGSSQNGAVLIFLPGWEDITRTRECLQASPVFGNRSQFLILPLHSMVPSYEQRKVFQRPPPDVRKIVLATNIAESAITIDDVVFVIDSGRVKEKSYDPYSNVSTLQTAWISKASAKQREGRAGRCQPGVCYHLFSRTRAAALPDFQLPEIKRTPLEELCLQVKLLEPNGRIATFISKAVEPPLDLSVRNAVLLLQDLGALTTDERLTELGKQLGSLPVHPSTSKMLLFAILLNCLDPALTAACAAGYREPFVLPMAPDQKKRAHQAKQELAASYGGYSDHLAVIAAFDGWQAAKVKGHDQEGHFCSQYFVSGGTMMMLAGMRRQLQNELAQKGFIPKGSHPCSLNAKDPGIVRAVLATGMYPMVGVFLPPLPNGKKAVVQTSRGEKVRIHPHSENFKLNRTFSSGESASNDLLLVFDEVTRGEAQVYIRNSTLVKPHPVIFIATEMVVAPLNPSEEMSMDVDEGEMHIDSEDEDDVKPRPGPDSVEKRQAECMTSPNKGVAVVIDRWLRFTATAVEAAQFYCLRERLNAAISFKIKYPREKLPPLLAASVYTIACILSFDNIPPVPRPFYASNPKSTNRSDLQAWFQGGQGHSQNGYRRERRQGPVSDSDNGHGKSVTQRASSSPGAPVSSERYVRQEGKSHAQSSGGRGKFYSPPESRQKGFNNTGSGRGSYSKRPKGGAG